MKKNANSFVSFSCSISAKYKTEVKSIYLGKDQSFPKKTSFTDRSLIPAAPRQLPDCRNSESPFPAFFIQRMSLVGDNSLVDFLPVMPNLIATKLRSKHSGKIILK